MRPRHLIGLAVALLGSALAAQTELTPHEARAAAAKLLAAGHPRASADVTKVLIDRDPQDAEALILHAHAQRTLRSYKGAQKAARQGWRASDRPVEQYGAALAMAQALSSDGKKTRAQFWLRRAAHVAPNDSLRARAARDYNYLRTTNPWSVNLSFGINPSDNVNNAPRDNTIVLGGRVFEDPNAVPISGFEIQTDVTLRYTLKESVSRRTTVALRWAEGHVVFTDNDVPAGVSASDFAYRRIEGQLGFDFQNSREAPRRNLTFSLGRLWTGGDALADEIKVSYRQTNIKGPGRQFSWNGSLGYSNRKDNDLRSGITASLGADWARSTENGGRLMWNAGITRTDTDSAAYTHTKLDFGVTYALPQKVMGAHATLAARTQFRIYDDALYGPDARQDEGLTLSASLHFVDFDTYGFAPKITLEANETQSNVTRFETRNFGLKIGFQTVF